MNRSGIVAVREVLHFEKIRFCLCFFVYVRFERVHYGYEGFNPLIDFEGVVLDVGIHSGMWSGFDLF